MAKKRTFKVWVATDRLDGGGKPYLRTAAWNRRHCREMALSLPVERATLTIESPAPKPQRRGK